MSNSVDPDETAHTEPSHLDLCCLQKSIIIACGSKRINYHKDTSATRIMVSNVAFVLSLFAPHVFVFARLYKAICTGY